MVWRIRLPAIASFHDPNELKSCLFKGEVKIVTLGGGRTADRSKVLLSGQLASEHLCISVKKTEGFNRAND